MGDLETGRRGRRIRLFGSVRKRQRRYRNQRDTADLAWSASGPTDRNPRATTGRTGKTTREIRGSSWKEVGTRNWTLFLANPLSGSPRTKLPGRLESKRELGLRTRRCERPWIR